MKETTLTQSFALLALNAQDSERMTVAKRVVLRVAAAAAAIELALDLGILPDVPLSVSPEDNSLSLYQQTALRLLLPESGALPLPQLLERAVHLRDAQLKELERAVADSLMGDKLIESIPSLLSCDMYIREAGLTYMEYRADKATYLGLSEALRAEAVEDGALTDDCIAMLFLLRESGAVADFFSEEELPNVGQRMLEAYRTNPLAKALYPLDIHKSISHSLTGILRAKSKLLAQDTGLGVSFLFPILERSKNIFIDVEGIGANAESRMESIRERLCILGHRWEMIHEGRVPLVRIDNVVYECIPDGVTPGGVGIRVPVYGVRLRRYPVFL